MIPGLRSIIENTAFCRCNFDIAFAPDSLGSSVSVLLEIVVGVYLNLHIMHRIVVARIVR